MKANLITVLFSVVLFYSCNKEESAIDTYSPTIEPPSYYMKYPKNIEYRIQSNASSVATYTILSGFNALGDPVFTQQVTSISSPDTTIKFQSIKYPYEKYVYEMRTISTSTVSNTLSISVDGELKCYRLNNGQPTNFIFLEY